MAVNYLDIKQELTLWVYFQGWYLVTVQLQQIEAEVLRVTVSRNKTRRSREEDMAAKFHDLTAKLLTGETFNFSSLLGKVVLIENVASLWGTTTRDYTQMNELHERYSSKGLVILGVPCNQFGHQVRALKTVSVR